MPHSKRKTRWYRGSRYHGWGQVSQHRKSGGRGGFGRAGYKKHKWFYVLKYERDHFGRHGFVSRFPEKITINVGDLEKYLDKVEDGVLNLDKLGINKLIGKGKINMALKIIVREASEKAIRKVEEAGGEVILAE